ncbi:MAG: T9SS type A sorting domain-containing protein [Taibaiella sp.]|nr:T9SS type A sorting domain-containing protein [Taibaiella sp.]
MKKYLVTFLALLSFSCLNAQPYTLSVLHDVYVPLVTSTSLNGSVVWDDIYAADVPLGFNFKIDTISTNAFFLSGPARVVSDTNMVKVTSGFFLTDAMLVDRGFVASASRSPLRYRVSGASGARIFKYEMFNAGFRSEYDSLGTLSDSISIQLWYYEGTNIVELRYGPSKISYPRLYFNNASTLGNPIVGYFKDNDPISGVGDFFLLSGDPLHPGIDSIHLDTSLSSQPLGLSSYPTNGTVYRFTPKFLGISNYSAITKVKVFPNPAKEYWKLDGLSNAAVIAVYNSVGRQIYSYSNTSAANTITINSVTANGLYVLEVKYKDGSVERIKLIKD